MPSAQVLVARYGCTHVESHAVVQCNGHGASPQRASCWAGLAGGGGERAAAGGGGERAPRGAAARGALSLGGRMFTVLIGRSFPNYTFKKGEKSDFRTGSKSRRLPSPFPRQDARDSDALDRDVDIVTRGDISGLVRGLTRPGAASLHLTRRCLRVTAVRTWQSARCARVHAQWQHCMPVHCQ